MAHSSLSAFGWVDGGAEAVIDGCLQAVGASGTVAMPTLCQGGKETRFSAWSITGSPSDVGRITEVFRRRPAAIRSDHPTHSVAAIGPRAEWVTGGHRTAAWRPSPWGPAAFGHGCPWDRLYEVNACYVFFGVNFRVNTTRHYIQARLVEDALLGAGWHPGIQRGRAWELERRLAGWLRPGVWPNYDDESYEALAASEGLVTYTEIGKARCLSYRTRPLVDHALGSLTREPDQWFDEAFLSWLGDARA